MYTCDRYADVYWHTVVEKDNDQFMSKFFVLLANPG